MCVYPRTASRILILLPGKDMLAETYTAHLRHLDCLDTESADASAQ
jgi:hypothetical protein